MTTFCLQCVADVQMPVDERLYAFASTRQSRHYWLAKPNPRPSSWWLRLRMRSATVVNNQLSGAGKVEIDLIDFLFKPSIYLYRFNSSPIGLDT
jgi:hypothetical protein